MKTWVTYGADMGKEMGLSLHQIGACEIHLDKSTRGTGCLGVVYIWSHLVPNLFSVPLFLIRQ